MPANLFGRASLSDLRATETWAVSQSSSLSPRRWYGCRYKY